MNLRAKISALQMDLNARPPAELETIYRDLVRLRTKLEDEAPDAVADIKAYRACLDKLEQVLMKIRREKLNEAVDAAGVGHKFPGTHLQQSLFNPLPEEAAGRGQILRAALQRDMRILAKAATLTARQLSLLEMRR